MRPWPQVYEASSERSRENHVRALGEQRAGDRRGPDGWSFDMDYRFRPLPPLGPLAFICAWPGRGIASSRVDGAAVLRAADAAVTLWSNDPYCSAD